MVTIETKFLTRQLEEKEPVVGQSPASKDVNAEAEEATALEAITRRQPRLEDGRQSTYDEPHLGWPSTSSDDAHVAQVREIVRSNPPLTVREIADECNILTGSILKRLRETVSRKIPQLWRNNSWFLHHDTAPAHALLLIRDFLANTNTTVLPQPPYPPDLSLADFSLFPKLKSTLKGRRF
ncbi:hypothetical protein B7P43_G03602 [Cryptotermes secundus]|uniref:Mos1 transposase HTH domain-containing protein n=1 Tax=Cryptotermes secundus TaxID=105785 RepID=A0A2J7Q006_9NEOP|nr:hypothetical protein B7P43_G03602 [Cryptotermes secundus]